MKPFFIQTLPLALRVFAVGICSIVGTRAAVRTWDGGGADSTWMNATNWAGDVAPSAGDDLVFPAGAPASTLTSITNLPNAYKQVTGQGLSNLTYTVQAATNLAAPVTWSNLVPATANASGIYQLTDTNAPLFPRRFYRTVSP